MPRPSMRPFTCESSIAVAPRLLGLSRARRSAEAHRRAFAGPSAISANRQLDQRPASRVHATTSRTSGSHNGGNMPKLHLSISGLSILLAFALALWEWFFFFYG